MDETLEQGIISSIIQFSENKTSFEIRLKDFSAFKPRVIFLFVKPNDKLHQLQNQLLEALASTSSFPIQRDERPFTAHLTIATRDLHKKAFREAWDVFKEKKYEANWVVQGISLLRHDEKKWEVIFTSRLVANVP
jgi:2'-5' RNA ligase